MAIALTTKATLDLVTLQARIKEIEELAVVRLTSLVGKKENNLTFNAHGYASVDNNPAAPFSTLFVVSGGGGAAADPVITVWLANHPQQRVVCEDTVFVDGATPVIAVVR